MAGGHPKNRNLPCHVKSWWQWWWCDAEKKKKKKKKKKKEKCTSKEVRMGVIVIVATMELGPKCIYFAAATNITIAPTLTSLVLLPYFLSLFSFI